MSPVLIVTPAGRVTGIHTDAIALEALGTLKVSRATSIEFDNAAQKWVVRDPEGHYLFSHASRSVCLAWEVEWLEAQQIDLHGGIAE